MADSQMAVRGQASLALRAKNVHKVFNGIEVLHGVDLEVPAGARHAVVGENGAGKSTLMKIICGILEPEAGEIEVFGEALPRGCGPRSGQAWPSFTRSSASSLPYRLPKTARWVTCLPEMAS